jgi:hypothetical protein
VAARMLAAHYRDDPDETDPESFFLQSYAYLWDNVAVDMVDIDPYWLDMIGALHYVGSRLYTGDSSDGMVPVANAVLPGATSSFRVGGTSTRS